MDRSVQIVLNEQNKELLELLYTKMPEQRVRQSVSWGLDKTEIARHGKFHHNRLAKYVDENSIPLKHIPALIACPGSQLCWDDLIPFASENEFFPTHIAQNNYDEILDPDGTGDRSVPAEGYRNVERMLLSNLSVRYLLEGERGNELNIQRISEDSDTSVSTVRTWLAKQAIPTPNIQRIIDLPDSFVTWRMHSTQLIMTTGLQPETHRFLYLVVERMPEYAAHHGHRFPINFSTLGLDMNVVGQAVGHWFRNNRLPKSHHDRFLELAAGRISRKELLDAIDNEIV